METCHGSLGTSHGPGTSAGWAGCGRNCDGKGMEAVLMVGCGGAGPALTLLSSFTARRGCQPCRDAPAPARGQPGAPMEWELWSPVTKQ